MTERQAAQAIKDQFGDVNRAEAELVARLIQQRRDRGNELWWEPGMTRPRRGPQLTQQR
jgi:hypothetical protein